MNKRARGAAEVFEVGGQGVLTAGVAVLPAVVEDEHQEEQSQVKDNPDAVNPDAPDDGLYVTEEEYWARWYANPYSDRDVKYEWNNGRLEAKPLSNPAQIALYNWFLNILQRYVQSHPIARLINLETGFSLTIEDLEEVRGEKKVVRRPDIGVIHNDNPVEWGKDDRSYKGVCDMCVESLSDSTKADVYRDTVEKRIEYAQGGVREYYILDPSEEYMHCYRRDAEGEYVEIEVDDDGVIRSRVLPGFQFRWDDLLRRPDMKELALDEVYSGYVFPEHQEAVARADREARRADREARRAAAEAAARKRAEEQAAVEAAARRRAEEQAAAEARRAVEEAAARRQAEDQAAMEAAARRQAEEQAAAEAAARRQAEDQAAMEAAARKQAEDQAAAEADRVHALEAELTRLRGQGS